MKKLLFIVCILLLAPLSRNDVEIKKNFNEIERIKQHLKTKKVTVDGVIQSLQPCARVYLSADQDDLVNGAETKILLNTESYDVGSDFDTTHSSFTVPVTGYYQINASIRWEGTELVADKTYVIIIKKNEDTIIYNILHASVQFRLKGFLSDVIYLTIGDEITLWGKQNSGGNLIDINSGESVTFLSIRLVQ